MITLANLGMYLKKKKKNRAVAFKKKKKGKREKAKKHINEAHLCNDHNGLSF